MLSAQRKNDFLILLNRKCWKLRLISPIWSYYLMLSSFWFRISISFQLEWICAYILLPVCALFLINFLGGMHLGHFDATRFRMPQLRKCMGCMARWSVGLSACLIYQIQLSFIHFLYLQAYLCSADFEKSSRISKIWSPNDSMILSSSNIFRS